MSEDEEYTFPAGIISLSLETLEELLGLEDHQEVSGIRVSWSDFSGPPSLQIKVKGEGFPENKDGDKIESLAMWVDKPAEYDLTTVPQ